MRPGYDTLLLACRPLFAQTRTFARFCQLIDAWVLCPTRRTVTGLLAHVPARARRPHDAYHRFFREAPWAPEALFDLLTRRLVRALCPDGRLILDLDDTLHHKTGRRVAGAGRWRDAVRSSGQQVVYAFGLSLVVVTLRVTPPWGGPPLALPVRVRLHQKGGPSYLDLACEMIETLARLLPGCRLTVCADGFYAPLACRLPATITLTSRLRSDAALYEAPRPRPAGSRGRPPRNGPRLPALTDLAAEAAALGLFALATLTRGTAPVERLVYSRQVRWQHVPLLLVIIRDPAGRDPDAYVFTTDVDACYLDLPGHYGGRWAIELTFRDVKQHLGGEEPQCWAGVGAVRAAMLAYWIHALVWYSFLTASPAEQATAIRPTPWYGQKATPSFADALAWQRRRLWTWRLSPGALPTPAPAENPDDLATLIDHLARVA